MKAHLPRFALGFAVLAVISGSLLLPNSAQAWWHGGFYVGLPPVVVGPPLVGYPAPYYYAPGYYPPPYYAAPYSPYAYPPYPPAQPQSGTAAPPSQPQMSEANTPYGRTCYAGVYTCLAPDQTHVGSVCSCPGLGAPSYGSVH